VESFEPADGAQSSGPADDVESSELAADVESFEPAAGPPLFLVSPGDLPADVVTLSGPEGHHAAAVRRLRAGERADVSDGAGTLAECVVASIARDSVVLSVRSVRTLPPPEPTITVVQALPKAERGERAVELMTEVGVDSVIAWAAERCVVRWHGERGARALGKWRATAREAAKQSRRAWLPEITGPATLSDVAARVSAAACAIVLEADAPAKLSALPMPGQGEILLVVGPEGGISPAERAALADAGAMEARLGPTVLRTSTAGAAAAAVLLAHTARW
jgi:16S rRNA (uracil1498-N3)-methyltransferase